LNVYDAFIKSTTDLISKLRAAPAQVATGDPSAAVLAAEIRTALPNDPLQVAEIYQDAIENGEQPVYDAIRLAPRFLKLLSPEEIAAGEARWEATRDPPKAKRIADLRNALDVLTGVIAAARAAIIRNAGLPTANPLAAAAKGGEA